MQPLLIKIGSFEIHWYGALMALGFTAGLWTAAFRARSEKIAADTLWNLGGWIIICSLLGAKLFHVIMEWRDYAEHFSSQPLRMLRSGVVFYGGLIGGVGATLWFTRKHKLSLWKIADVMAPSLALGHAFGRIGCLMEGCCYGKPCDLPWAMTMYDLPRHPTQLYEAAGLLLIFSWLHWLFPLKKFDGQIWWLYCASYAILRFTVEMFRGDYGANFYLGPLTVAQVLSLGLLGLAVVMYFRPRPVTRP